LFNAVVGRKLAIVHEMSGVTRDRVSSDIRWQGQMFTLVDTGGLNTLDDMEKNVDFWDAGISDQAQCAMESADVLIFVCDSQSGLTPLDIDVARRIRQLNKPVFVAANKCDSDEWKNHAAEFSQLGFKNIYPICCTHRGGINTLITAALKECPYVPVAAVVKKAALNIAVVGRPNVGKSSLVNALLGEERLMTSPVAGTTRDAVKIEFAINDGQGGTIPVQLVDTAGLRKTGKVDNVVEMFKACAHRVGFLHLRSTQVQNGDFFEAPHFEGRVDMYELVKAICEEQIRRKNEGRSDWRIPFRPDHGADIMDDLLKQPNPNPGYGGLGRMRGLAGIRGLEVGIMRSLYPNVEY
jgi:ribosome-associated GTPase EngA